MSRRTPRRPPAKSKKPKQRTSRFTPTAFLAGSPEFVQELCAELAVQAGRRFLDLTGTSWNAEVARLVQELREIGHDLTACDGSEEFQEWEASWYLPRGNFSLFLSFRAPGEVEVTFRADDAKYFARA